MDHVLFVDAPQTERLIAAVRREHRHHERRCRARLTGDGLLGDGAAKFARHRAARDEAWELLEYLTSLTEPEPSEPAETPDAK